MYNPKDHLKKLVEAHAPSGYEAPIADILREDWADLVDEFDSDRLGSLIGIKRATRPTEQTRKIMLAAHMDEIGLMVREIKDGFIYVHRISGIDSRVMMAQAVLVHGKARPARPGGDCATAYAARRRPQRVPAHRRAGRRCRAACR